MTTFQAIVYAIIRGFTQFLPLSWDGHRALVPWLIHWPQPAGHFDGALALGMFLAAFLYYWNDWASILSSMLQILLLRRKPMTLDERMPFFIMIATLPALLIGPRLEESLRSLNESPWVVAGVLGAFAFPLWLTDSRSRRNKNLFDWNWLDALIVGVFLLLATSVTGIGAVAIILTVASSRNYSREAGAKFALYVLTPLLLVQAVRDLGGLNFHTPTPDPDITWLTLAVALIVSWLSGILTIGAFMKHVQRKGTGQYVTYRIAFAVGTMAIIWFRTRQ
jgi:undecaprenyl-diphosphatase